MVAGRRLPRRIVIDIEIAVSIVAMPSENRASRSVEPLSTRAFFMEEAVCCLFYSAAKINLLKITSFVHLLRPCERFRSRVFVVTCCCGRMLE